MDEFTADIKLQALAMRFYQGYVWEPKVGDYYTLNRGDLELFKIRDEDALSFYIEMVAPNPQRLSDAWGKLSFLEGFGNHRTFVHPEFLKGTKYEQ